MSRFNAEVMGFAVEWDGEVGGRVGCGLEGELVCAGIGRHLARVCKGVRLGFFVLVFVWVLVVVGLEEMDQRVFGPRWWL